MLNKRLRGFGCHVGRERVDGHVLRYRMAPYKGEPVFYALCLRQNICEFGKSIEEAREKWIKANSIEYRQDVAKWLRRKGYAS